MKFIGIILLILTSIFLIACSANQASNKISNSELENLASKYGGVYIFNKKFYEEINNNEKMRREAELAIVNASKTDAEMRQNLKGFDKKYPRILSNGKQYYQRRNYSKKVVIPDDVVIKLKNFMGETAYKASSIMIDEFYFDNENLKVISLDVNFYEGYTKYGLFGDEGRGFSLSQTTLKNISGDNKFILNNNKFEKVK